MTPTAFPKFFEEQNEARQAIRAFVDYMRQRVSAKELNQTVAAHIQLAVIRIMQEYHGIYDLGRGLNLILTFPQGVRPVPVPQEDDVSKVLAFSDCLFNGLTDLILETAPYPYALKVPPYLEWPNDVLWLFPSKRWRITPEENVSDNDNLTSPVIDYQNGRLHPPGTNAHRYAAARHRWGSREITERIAIRRVAAAIEAANDDPYHSSRMERGKIAMQAFYTLFIASTGMNPAQVNSLIWNTDLEDGILRALPERQNFRAVKYRANNKEVTFSISARYIPYLIKFLKLRKHLLKGRDFELLFFQYPRSNKKLVTYVAPEKLRRVWESDYYNTLWSMTKKVPRVTPQQFRSAKQDYLIRTTDVSVAAQQMQHSVRTAIQKYSNGSEKVAQEELGKYLVKVEDLLIKRGEEDRKSKESAVGTCTSMNNPLAITEEPPVRPNCVAQEGCLYCDKYRVHADEIDVRKLLSLHYCLRQTAHLAQSAEEHASVFGPLLGRIEVILQLIRESNPIMEIESKRLTREIEEEGLLEPYWAAKFEFLMELSEI